jgi:hypothetical protein
MPRLLGKKRGGVHTLCVFHAHRVTALFSTEELELRKLQDLPDSFF